MNANAPQERLSIYPDGSVHLKISGKSFSGPRYLGQIVGNCFHTDRNPEKHLLRVLQAYGFNYGLMKQGQFERVVVHTPAGELETTRRTILEYGQFLHFAGKGFERQVFLRIEDFPRGPKLTPPHSQLSLFRVEAA